MRGDKNEEVRELSPCDSKPAQPCDWQLLGTYGRLEPWRNKEEEK